MMPVIDLIDIPNEVAPKQIDNIVSDFIRSFSLDLHDKVIEIKFCTNEEIKALNHKFRNIDRSTDVLSFPQAQHPGPGNIYGTIVISPSDATERGEDLYDLVKHGLLHLAGFDHEVDAAGWKEAAGRISHNMGI